MIEDPHNFFHKVAIVLFNMGGPSSLDKVEDFLMRLFSDKAIIDLPQPFRWMLAKYISKKRKKEAMHIYKQIGGKSPLVDNTLLQADALQKIMQNGENFYKNKNIDYRVFISMSYCKPFIEDTLKKINDYTPNKIVLLPLYPQYSTTTTGSFFHDWHKKYASSHLKAEVLEINDYYNDPSFIQAHVEMIKIGLKYVNDHYENIKLRIIFSAHSLPQRIIDKGDPYQNQIISSVELIMNEFKGRDYIVSYQSKVGKEKWIGPSTESTVIETAQKNTGILLVPIAFVSEHSETLYELDIEYRELAEANNAPCFIRIKALGANSYYIECLKNLIVKKVKENMQ